MLFDLTPPWPGQTLGTVSRVPPAKRLEVEVGDRTLSLSNLDKVLYPAAGFTKGAGDRLLHADRAGPAAAPARPPADAQALPERRRRAVLLREAVPGAPARLGADRARSGQRRNEARRSTTASPTTCRRSCGWPTSPTSSCTRSLALRRRRRARRRWSPSTSTRGRRRRSSSAREVALRLREAFEHLGLEAFPKTSGSKGMQVYVPLNTPATYDADASRSRSALAQLLERARPGARRLGHEQGRGARARCSSTGARTTSTRRRSTSTRCARASGRRSRRR